MAEMKAEELSNCKCYLPCLMSSEVSGIVFSTFIYCSTKLETTKVFVFLKISIQLILVILFLPRYNDHDEKSAETSRNQENNFIGKEQSDRVIRSFIENLCNSMIH